jgi:hypothetical protein
MSKENPLWGAPRIHGGLLKLGFEIAESTVSKHMIRRRGPPSRGWRTFLRNHAEAIAAIDLCVVPTLTFECLFAFLVLGHSRRQLLWFAVTRHPTAEWLAQQIVEAFPRRTAPAYLVRDNDRACAPRKGHYFQRKSLLAAVIQITNWSAVWLLLKPIGRSAGMSHLCRAALSRRSPGHGKSGAGRPEFGSMPAVPPALTQSAP